MTTELEPLVMPSDEKEKYVEFFWIEGEQPFICGVAGGFTTTALGNIEDQFNDQNEGIDYEGDGQYLYRAFYEKEEYEGYQIINEAYWDLTKISFKALEA